ncbi:MAG: hypothetical protein HY716_15380 [Planctomycetes bacterium]|nr:hypothetical protein [Planctomycetota bacterium]
MRKTASTAVLAFAAIWAIAGSAEAQVHRRWKLDYTHEKPRVYTYRNSTGELENYWFLVYTIRNNTDQIIPILIDHMMYTETGKELQTDYRKVDPDRAKEVAENPRQYEPLKFGKFTSNVILPPEVEYKLIEYHAKLGNRSDGIIRESIEELKQGDEKGNRWYLNPREMRMQRFIRPGQAFHGVAIFKGIDPRARILEVHISGLWDVMRVEQYFAETDELDDITIVYENRVLKYSYDFKGDEFERERDFLALRRSPEWVIKHIGPVASKTTIDTLIATLLKVLNRWSELVRQSETPQKVEAEIAEFNLTPDDFVVSARVVQMALGRDFGYDVEKSLMDNQTAVWRMHEWWVTHKNKLAFNEITGRFEVHEEILPGTQKD